MIFITTILLIVFLLLILNEFNVIDTTLTFLEV